MKAAATPAIAVLIASGVNYRLMPYHHDARTQGFGDAAVAQLTNGDISTPAQVLKTLVLDSPAGLALAVLPVPLKLSLKAAALALGTSKAVMADPEAAQRTTGYVLGGISPFGQRRTLPTIVDDTALHFHEILCSAGKRGLAVGMAPLDLVQLTGAKVAPICAGN